MHFLGLSESLQLYAYSPKETILPMIVGPWRNKYISNFLSFCSFCIWILRFFFNEIVFSFKKHQKNEL